MIDLTTCVDLYARRNTLDKYEYQVHADQIKKLINEKRFAEAMNVADGIDWRKVRSVSMLQTVSEVYKINKRYEEARDILMIAYDRYPTGRTIVYALCELAIKLNDVVYAKLLYEEYVKLAPEDTGRYVLLYKMYEALDVSLEERIELLEEYKKKDYTEKWAYELAYLYHKTGQETKCIEACDELILWFGEGKYVKKAMELKMKHVRLSREQQLKYEGRQEPIPVTDKFMGRNQIPVQQAYDTDPQAGNLQQIPMTAYEQNNVQPRQEYAYDEPVQESMQMLSEPLLNDNRHTTPMLTTSEIDKIEIKPVNVGMYNTIDLQNGLSKNIKEFFERENEQSAAVDNNVVHSADPESYNHLYENNSIDLTDSNGPVISLRSIDPAENEMDEVPGKEEDVQMTTFIPVNQRDQYVKEDEDEEDDYTYSNLRNEHMNEDEARVLEEEMIRAHDMAPVRNTGKGYTRSLYEADGSLQGILGEDYEEEESEPELKSIYENWEIKKRENEERRIREAKALSLQQTSDIMAQLKGVLPEIDDIAKSVPPRRSDAKPYFVMPTNIPDENGLKKEAYQQDTSVENEIYKDVFAGYEMYRNDPVKQDTGNDIDFAVSRQEEPVYTDGAEGYVHTQGAAYAKQPEEPLKEETGELLYTEKKPVYREQPVEQQYVEEQPVEEQPVEQQPVKEQPIEQQPVKEQPVEQQPVNEQPVEQQPVEEQPVEQEQPVEEQPVEQQYVEEQPVEEQPVEQEQPVEEQPVEQQPEELADTEEEPEYQEQPEDKQPEEPLSEETEQTGYTQEGSDELTTSEVTDEIGIETEELPKIENPDWDEQPIKEVTYEPDPEPVALESDDNSDARKEAINNELYFKEIMDIDDSEEDEEKETVEPEASEERSYSEDEETSRRAAFEVTSELPSYPYEALDDYGEVEEMVVIEQPDGIDSLMKTDGLPLDEIARANYEAGVEFEYDDLDEPKKKKERRREPGKKKKYPTYMKLDMATEVKRDFDDDEKQIFNRFRGIGWLKNQLIDAIDKMSMEPARGNVVVMGSETSGRKTIAVNLIKLMQSMDVNFKGKVAKISGEALNKKDIPLTIKKLRRGALIVENAEGLTPSSARLVAEALELESEPVLVILEGDKEKLTEIFSASKEVISRVFDSRIDLQEFSTDDLVAYGKSYAEEDEYTIDEMGTLALYRRIGDLQSPDHTPGIEDVIEIVDNAKKHVGRKNMSHFMDVLLAKRYDDNDNIILREKDFVV